MKRIVTLVAVAVLLAAVSGPLFAGGPGEDRAEISHGQFAQMLLEVLATKESPDLTPDVALERAKQLGLLPEEWAAADTLTQSELASVLQSLCPSSNYQPGNPAAGVSAKFAAALIRRTVPCFRQYLGQRIASGDTDTKIGGNIDAALSPSDF